MCALATRQVLLLIESIPWDIVVKRGGDEVEIILGPVKEGKIHVIEALYLLYKGVAQVVDKNGKDIDFEELIRMYSIVNPYAWVEFETYLDLRKRGRHPVPGPRPHTFLLRRRKRENKYTHYILVLEENRLISLETLYSFIREAFSNSWEPILAIVDRYGDITYYEALIFRPGETRLVETESK